MSGSRRMGVMTDRWGFQPFAWFEGGVLTWSWRYAPDELVTRRQMRAEGLAPAGASPVAQIVCRGGRRWANLWDRSELSGKRIASAAQLAALDKALAARRWCPVGQHDAGYCIRWSLGMCEDCVLASGRDLTGVA